jgi:hypothetical protein
MAALEEEPDIDALLNKRARVDVEGQGARSSAPFVVDAIPILPVRTTSSSDLMRTASGAARSDHRLLLSVFELIAGHKLAEVFQVGALSGGEVHE